MRSKQSDDSRLRLVCTSNGYTVVTVNWGSEPVIAQGTELTEDSGETWATAHSVSVRFDDADAQRETWWLRSTGNFSRVRQAYYRGAHPGFIQELRGTDALTVWANTESGTFKAEFDVRNLDYALSQNPEHCREPDAYGKWLWDEWETNSGKASYAVVLYAEGSDDIHLVIYCRGDEPNNRSASMIWGERRPAVSEDGYKIKRNDGSLHSTGHPVKVRYGQGLTQRENWQLLSTDVSSRNQSLPQAYIGAGSGWIYQLTRVDTLTVATETETIRAEFDVRRLDKALTRLNEHCR